MTTNNTCRLPAEWSNHSAVLLSWPHPATDWAYILDQVTECYINVARAISRVAHLVIASPDPSAVATALKGYVDRDRFTVIETETNDTWARDFGMICATVPDGWRAYDYKFNGWGLKFASCHDNLINRHLFRSGIIDADRAVYTNRLGFVLEGGSIDIDDNGTLLTTSECLLSPNRNGHLDKHQITDRLIADFGAEKVIWLEHGALEGDDTDSHIDTLARFIPGHKIVYTSCDRPADTHYHDLAAMASELAEATDASGQKYETMALPIPSPIYDEDGQRLPATYANFLIINGAIFLPVYGDEHYDQIAIETMRKAAPGYEIIPVNCLALIQQHGSLHCITMQIPSEILRISQ